jgi:hypothetical protein
MGDPRLQAAERQRRRRRHVRGDHSGCLPTSCPAAGESLTVTSQPKIRKPSPSVTTTESDNRPAVSLAVGVKGERGARLWADMADELGPAHRVLLEEACRIADRLDRLDALLEGRQDSWLHLAGEGDGTQVRVVVDGLLAETRQQATALRGLVAELRAVDSKAGKVAAPAKKKGSGLADLVSLADRRRATSS